QQRIDQQYHPTASFLGGMLPYLLTMKPGSWVREVGDLPKDATTLQRIMKNPATAHIFGGVVVGGLEVGQELVDKHTVDWRDAAIATGFGLIFNKPNRIGE